MDRILFLFTVHIESAILTKFHITFTTKDDQYCLLPLKFTFFKLLSEIEEQNFPVLVFASIHYQQGP